MMKDILEICGSNLGLSQKCQKHMRMNNVCPLRIIVPDENSFLDRGEPLFTNHDTCIKSGIK